jgi:hypothetical protein
VQNYPVHVNQDRQSYFCDDKTSTFHYVQ